MNNQEIGFCDECKRLTWNHSEIGKKCKMIQPNGFKCEGVFVSNYENENSIDKIKSVLNEINESRSAASEGMWVNVCADDHPLIYFEAYSGCYGIEIGEDGAVCYPEGRLSKKDSEFIVMAANKITQLTRALEVAVDALEFYESEFDHVTVPENLNKISEILEVKT